MDNKERYLTIEYIGTFNIASHETDIKVMIVSLCKKKGPGEGTLFWSKHVGRCVGKVPEAVHNKDLGASDPLNNALTSGPNLFDSKVYKATAVCLWYSL